jgi:hypothetical protein
MSCRDLCFDEDIIRDAIRGLKHVETVIDRRLANPRSWNSNHVEEIQKLSHQILDIKTSLWLLIQP